MLGGNFVNRFSIQGRSYKVIPQVKRAERLTPDQLRARSTSAGPNGKLVPLSTFATLKTTTEPRDLKRFQQLNAVRIQGVIPPGVSLDQALKVPRGRGAQDPAAGLHDRLRRRIAPAAHRGRQVPRRRSCSRRSSSSSCSPRSSRASAIRSSSCRAPCRSRSPARCSSSFLGFTTLNIYSQVGLITLVGLVARRTASSSSSSRTTSRRRASSKLEAVIEAAAHAPAADPHDDRGHRRRATSRSSSPRGPGAGARNSIGIMLVTGMIIGTAFTLFVVPSIYMLVARTHAAAPARERETEPGAPGLAEPAG